MSGMRHYHAGAPGAPRLPVNGEKVVVPDTLHLRCPNDGEIVLRLDDADTCGSMLWPSIGQYSLLSSDEIRSIRSACT